MRDTVTVNIHQPLRLMPVVFISFKHDDEILLVRQLTLNVNDPNGSEHRSARNTITELLNQDDAHLIRIITNRKQAAFFSDANKAIVWMSEHFFKKT